ncbi:GtrA family protein [Candidatus Giovannonibacteria bacterium]|nr:GtrA family protein [Candidatus Giovannonibacteria bacterium]
MKKDFLLALIAGLIAGVFLFPTLRYIELKVPFENLLLLIVLPLGSGLFIWFVGTFGQRFFQFGKFFVAGGLNFVVFFGVLNLLMAQTGITEGFGFSLFSALSFIIANINSYLWNKFWTFSMQSNVEAGEYVKFLIVSAVSLALTVGVASFIVNVVRPQFGIEPKLWANIGAAFGSIVALLANFFGYKFFVFRK